MNLGKGGRRWGEGGKAGRRSSLFCLAGGQGRCAGKRTESPVVKGHLTSKQAKGASTFWAEGTACAKARWYKGMWHFFTSSVICDFLKSLARKSVSVHHLYCIANVLHSLSR